MKLKELKNWVISWGFLRGCLMGCGAFFIMLIVGGLILGIEK